MFGAPKFRPSVPGLVVVLVLLAITSATRAEASNGRIGPALHITANGRLLRPAGRETTLGNFPTGGALSPDGRFFWAVDSGDGRNDVKVVSVRTGRVVQTLPLPGAYGAATFAPDGRTAYVSGEPAGQVPARGATRGDRGDVVHVFKVSPRSGHAVERRPIALPADSGSLAWPVGLAVSPDGRTLAVALNLQNALGLVNLRTRAVRIVQVDQAPTAVAMSADGHTAFVACEGSGTVDAVAVNAGSVTGRIDVAPGGELTAHPAALLVDRRAQRLYVAVASRDQVAVIDLRSFQIVRRISLARAAGPGVQPVALAISPSGGRLYVADSGEDAVAVVPTRGRRRWRVAGRVPVAAYPTGVALAAGGRKLVWLSANGLGTGPNPNYTQFGFNSAPYGSYLPQMLVGRLGVLRTPRGHRLRRLTARANKQVIPAGAEATPPPGTPVVGPGGVGSPSQKIKYVFYIVRENRTYDQIFGSNPRGDGDPALQLFDDNNVRGPAGGVTPNAHALSRIFPLLDHVYANSSVSRDGHPITSSSWAIDYLQRSWPQRYAGRGRDEPYTTLDLPPKATLFDEAARRGVSFRDYGEGFGLTAAEDDGRATFDDVQANIDWMYGSTVLDAGNSDLAGVMAQATSGKFDVFHSEFEQQLADGDVPQLNYFILPADHTQGTEPGALTPKALVANNDLALGQFVELISNSPIWPQSAIFVVEDDAQDGADHVDAHRMPAFVISPWAKRGAVIHTRYDQESVLRTIELILGLYPLSLNDGLATPMYDAFGKTAHVAATRYTAIAPTQSLQEVNPPHGPDAKLSAALPFDQLDLVPEAILDRILWHSVYGESSTPPAPGPNASIAERERARGAMRAFHTGVNVRRWLEAHSLPDPETARFRFGR